MTDSDNGTRIDEIAEDIYRISTRIPPDAIPGGFTFNQFLVRDDAPLLFHTGPRKLFAMTQGAIERVLPASTLRYVAFSHFEPDECGALNDFLAIAPQAEPVCSRIGAMVCMGDYADRPAHALADGDILSLGHHRLQWFDTPHLPHGWDCGFLSDTTTHTLFCGDLFTQFGDEPPVITRSDILEPSEAARQQLDYYAHGPQTRPLLERLAATAPTTLACMHGAAWTGDGGQLLRALADRVG
ncbi:MBL fold metallo-hydrolase [Nitrogeniibacter mangrovi]|uniref:MBL fold metallo-hydrolase n=1 Tax=Nitrogeniibacter mangrovi TaxID=2016596 RepID=A0A6C1B1S0_9RHOO|nr:FprA family A-type flavoprotein [Nitrogeniibacter mangrovi]QID17576.1 MBL fold metallo-hydrolase [Nitrogeniibacter mangrovi]